MNRGDTTPLPACARALLYTTTTSAAAKGQVADVVRQRLLPPPFPMDRDRDRAALDSTSLLFLLRMQERGGTMSATTAKVCVRRVLC